MKKLAVFGLIIGVIVAAVTVAQKRKALEAGTPVMDRKVEPIENMEPVASVAT